MKSINILYKNNNHLKEFISKYKFEDNTLVQIFTGILDKNLI